MFSGELNHTTVQNSAVAVVALMAVFAFTNIVFYDRARHLIDKAVDAIDRRMGQRMPEARRARFRNELRVVLEVAFGLATGPSRGSAANQGQPIASTPGGHRGHAT